MNDRHDLNITLNSHFPLITVQSHEERRTLDLLRELARKNRRPMYRWSTTEGLRREVGGSRGSINWNDVSIEGLKEPLSKWKENTASREPQVLFKEMQSLEANSIVVLLDFHPYLDDPLVIRQLKELSLHYYERPLSIVLLSHEIELPPELQRFAADFEFALPDHRSILKLIKEEASLWAMRNGNHKVRANRDAFEALARSLTGLTLSDAKRLIRNAIYDDGVISDSDIPEVLNAKYELIGQEGLLSFEYDTARFAEVGGFERLKRWIAVRKPAFLEPDDEQLDPPKGIMLLGVQGGGKSLAAKAVAGGWGVPLLRLDFATLYNKYFGESEKNLQRALKAAEAMAPCVLWIDEIEKGISTGDSDNGTSRRLLGSLLTWMAERRSAVFIVATANDISALPPELVRKGRLDEIFFVDLPVPQVRELILAIHLDKRNVERNDIDLAALAAASEGYSGAELEQAVVSALYSARAEQRAVDSELLLNEIRQTRPLSIVMGEEIQALRDWAASRTVAVD